MTGWRRFFILWVTAIGLASAAWAGDSVLKVSGKALQIGVGARAVGMGEAQAAAADDAYALYWNPAGLARLSLPMITLMHNAWFGDIGGEYISYAQSLPHSGFGVGINYIHYGDFDKYGIDANNYPVPLGSKFSAYTLVTTAGYAYRFSQELILGGALKLISESVDTYSNLSVAVDLGLQSPQILPGLDVAFVAQNLGLPMQGFNLPINLKAGAAYALPFVLNEQKDRFLAVLDFNLQVPVDQPFYTNLGLEYWYDNTVALRAGYKISELNNLGAAAGLTAGLGLRVSDYSVDYALATYGELGLTHRVSFTAAFGETKKTRRTARRAAAPKPAARNETNLSLGQIAVPKISGLTLRTPVTIQVESELSPAARNCIQKAVFHVDTNGERTIADWRLRIHDGQGHLVREMTEHGTPPEIEWDGRDASGKAVNDSIFCTYEFGYILEDTTKDTLTGKLLEAAPVSETAEATPDRLSLAPILFEENSYDLTPTGIQAITAAAKIIKKRPYTQIMVEGYSDAGSEQGQEFLTSQRRADAVVRYLTATFKIPFTKITVHARGSKNPVAANQTEAGRVKNRRVEITIIYPH